MSFESVSSVSLDSDDEERDDDLENDIIHSMNTTVINVETVPESIPNIENQSESVFHDPIIISPAAPSHDNQSVVHDPIVTSPTTSTHDTQQPGPSVRIPETIYSNETDNMPVPDRRSYENGILDASAPLFDSQKTNEDSIFSTQDVIRNMASNFADTPNPKTNKVQSNYKFRKRPFLK